MNGSSKEKAPATHSSAPTSPANEMPAEADSLPMILLGAPASRRPVGSRKPEPAGETPALPGTVPRFMASMRECFGGIFSLKSERPEAGSNDRWLVPGVCIFLAAIVWVVFGQTLHHEFVNYDDNLYVYENPAVAHGLSLEGIGWAFTHTVAANWHPLTLMSHMLDCELYGLNAGGHHLTSVLLHTASVILLFLVLRRMMGLRPEKGNGATTPQAGYLWRCAFVAAVFAIHPLRAESVAWVAERKDVLSGLFFMLTLWAYARYAQGVTSDAGPAFAKLPPSPGFGATGRRGRQVTRKPAAVPAANPSPVTRHPSLFYCLVLLFFALGLMCKPMLVTLPFVLLLLDYWPLQRFTIHGSRNTPPLHHSTTPPLRLLLEKLPLLGLTLASCLVTIFTQTEAIQPVPLSLRIGNALVSYVAYLGQMIFPVGLAVDYPHPGISLPLWKILAALALLLVISAGAIAARRKRPWFLFGWLWYLGMLVPVIGILQTGSHARADRYTYLPQIGLYLLLTWAAAELCAGWRHRRVMLGGLSTVILAALIFCARVQTAYWRNSESLWTHTLACTSDNFIGHDDLGNALLQKGNVDEAIFHFQMALQLKPDSAEAHNNLGSALGQKGRVDEAITHFQKALEIKPDYVDACNNLGYALLQQGSVSEAITRFQMALQIKPDNAVIRNNLDQALLQKSRVDETISRYQNALQIKSDSVEVLNNLAWLLATCPDAQVRDGTQAVKYAEQACELTHFGVTPLVGTLAAAYAEAGRYDDAVAAAQKACALAEKSGEQDLLKRNQELLVLYRAHQPYHESAEEFFPAAPQP